MGFKRNFTAAMLAAAMCQGLAGCAASNSPEPGLPCPLTGLRPMAVVELFFGRSVEGREPVSQAEWDDFAARILATNFPAGFTVADGEGAWRNPGTGVVMREPTKILTVAVPWNDTATEPHVAAVTAAYRARFHQISVGVLLISGCGAF